MYPSVGPPHGERCHLLAHSAGCMSLRFDRPTVHLSRKLPRGELSFSTPSEAWGVWGGGWGLVKNRGSGSLSP